MIAGPVLLGWCVDQAPAAALCGYPVAAGAAALAFGTGAIMVLPPIGGFAGMLFNLAFLTIATVIAARYFRRFRACPDE